VAHAALNESGQVSHASRHHRVAHHDGQTAVPEANHRSHGVTQTNMWLQMAQKPLLLDSGVILGAALDW
jgi:hypothetical protein